MGADLLKNWGWWYNLHRMLASVFWFYKWINLRSPTDWTKTIRGTFIVKWVTTRDPDSVVNCPPWISKFLACWNCELEGCWNGATGLRWDGAKVLVMVGPIDLEEMEQFLSILPDRWLFDCRMNQLPWIEGLGRMIYEHLHGLLNSLTSRVDKTSGGTARGS